MGAGKSVVIDETCASVVLNDGEIVVVSTPKLSLVDELHESIQKRMTGRKVGKFCTHERSLGKVIVSCNDSLPNLARMLKVKDIRVALLVIDECHGSTSDTMDQALAALTPTHILGFTATAFRSDMMETLKVFKKCIYTYSVADAIRDKVVVPWEIRHHTRAFSEDELDAVCLDMISRRSGPGIVNALSISDAENFAEKLTATWKRASAIHSRHTLSLRKQIMEDLRTGKLAAVVHVNLLSEGANYPWLLWMCLRREVGARVRFIQEIGRLLRAWEGKEYAGFDDPHDLFGTFNLSYSEALGEPPDREVVEREARDPAIIAGRLADCDPAIALNHIESLARALVCACEVTKMLPEGRKVIPKAERLKPGTPAQHSLLAHYVKLTIGRQPLAWSKCLDLMLQRPAELRYGFCADLITSLDCIHQAGYWPPVDEQGRIQAIPVTKEEDGQHVMDFKLMSA